MASSDDNDRKPAANVIDLVDSSSSDSETETEDDENYEPQNKSAKLNDARKKPASGSSDTSSPRRQRVVPKLKPPPMSSTKKKRLQAGLVLEEDVDHGSDSSDAVTVYTQEQAARAARGERPLLFTDEDFETLPSSIHGTNEKATVTCSCKGKQEARLFFKARKGRTTVININGRNVDNPYQNQQTPLYPYYHCATNKCKFFQWAFTAENMQWYRFGKHTGHCIVGEQGFTADDLSQGRVGDCWFLSALAVVAERPDLILRLFGNGKFTELNEHGMVQVNLFVDGYWKTVVVDNFLPCLVDEPGETALQKAIQASLGGAALVGTLSSTKQTSSDYDPHALADKCYDVVKSTHELLQQHPASGRRHGSSPCILQRPAQSADLAYSKAKHNQLWVPFLEKAYSKSHGSYKAISGGHIHEAFLDLTGAPTLVHNFDSRDFEPRCFWFQLLQYRRQRLPMGCSTSGSAAGIIGRHAYSILDVREVKNVSFGFFQETGVAHGNVSGFTEYDGTVRLLRIRNPHGHGEWKGDFSDKSQIWEKLLQHQEGANGNPGLHRSMKNDGTFWIDYDNFLMGFRSVDVVLAFLGNHAKSFSSNFPAKKSNHRCHRAFEVSLLDKQPGLPNRDTVEVYVMGIQKTGRGASRGRSDRKKSYKVTDFGMVVGENHDTKGVAFDDSDMDFTTVNGQMFGFRRNGHIRLILDRKKNKNVVVMPVSFGHPAATDKELSFVLRFVSDAPLLICELPNVPRMDVVILKYCLAQSRPWHTGQGAQRVLLEDPTYRLVQVDCRGNGGGTVFLYLCVNQDELRKRNESDLSFSVEANCRGMSCRTEHGLLQHETVAKGKMFDAHWRRYKPDFIGEQSSRLLLVLFRSGKTHEFGSIVCKRIATPRKLGHGSPKRKNALEAFLKLDPELSSPARASPSRARKAATEEYNRRGIFNAISGDTAFELSGKLGGKFAARADRNGFEAGFDDELQRALALSRGDLELQKALELSRQETTQKADDGVGNIMSFDEELQKAIELSKEDGQRSPPSRGAEVVDLTDEAAPVKRRKTNESSEGEKTDKPIDLAEKRRLAAQAAMKRLSGP